MSPTRLSRLALCLAAVLIIAGCGTGVDDPIDNEQSLSTAPALRDARFAANASTSTVVVPRPSTVSGDVLLAVVSARGNPTITAPSGWKQVREDRQGTTLKQIVYVKAAGISEPSSYTWTLSRAIGAAGAVMAWSGVDTSAPINAHGGLANAKSTTLTAPSISSTVGGTRLVAMFGTFPHNPIAPPSNMTERGEVASTAGQYDLTLEAADGVATQSGSTGVRKATSKYAQPSIGQLVALAPAKTSGGTVTPDAGTTAPIADAGTSTGPVDAGTPDAGGSTVADAGTAPPPPAGTTKGLLISAQELAALPMSGTAWTALKSVADGSPGTADIKNQDNMHGTRVLGVALVYARTGTGSYREKARAAIMSAIGTEVGGRTLALGRNLASYVMAADLIDLKSYSPSDDQKFRNWLTVVRTQYIGGHGRWFTLTQTHEDTASNWGAYAGASRIAASLYLGDTVDVARAAQVLKGWMGDRTAYASFRNTAAYEESWACNPAAWTPVNPPCMKNGINIDGALVEDISRGGPLAWPPGESGISYTSEALRGVYLQAELLHRAGYDTYNWSNKALLRATEFLFSTGFSQPYTVDRWLPWLANERYGTKFPTKPAAYGRVLGYTDWLYGS